jgi:hypothetical protein
MTMNSRQGRSVDPEELLLRTDWGSVEHCCPNTAPATPAILRQLLDNDTGKQGAALRDLQPKSPTRDHGRPMTSVRNHDLSFASVS